MFVSHEVFNGSIPNVCMQQILRAADYGSWDKVYVACSGLFSFERAFRKVGAGRSYHGNDVSLMSAAIAGLAMDTPVDFRFAGRVKHWQEELSDLDPEGRVAALLLVLYLGRVYGTENDYNRAHWRFYESRLAEHVDKMRGQVHALTSELDLASYYSGDFRDHLEKGVEEGAALVISAPFIQGWYERWFRFIRDNLEWAAPDYRLWNPEDFPALVDWMDGTGRDYVAVYKDELPGRRLIAYHRMGMKPRFYVYANRARVGSVVDQSLSGMGTPFRFTPVDIARLGPETKVEVYACKAGYADYIKSLYLQENIPWTSGPVNFLVYLDDMLAGILTFSASKQKVGEIPTWEALYLLSDTATTRFGRVSKLLAMLAKSATVLHHAEGRLLKHQTCRAILTTVRSNNPVSMKYRGIYKLMARKEPPAGERSGASYIINYAGFRDDREPQDIYREWWRKHYRDDRARKVTTSYAK